MTSAVVLAAGAGSRLGIHGPKCLVEVGGFPLLTRYVRALDAIGVKDAIVIAGDHSATIGCELRRVDSAVRTRVVRSPYRTKGALSSLRFATELGIEGPILLMDSDVLFPVESLARLSSRKSENSLLMDLSRSSGGEEMMVGVNRDGRVTEIARVLQAECSYSGEGLGLALLGKEAFDCARVLCNRLCAAPGWEMLEWEFAVSRIASEVDICAIDVEGRPWIEIDFPEDLADAQRIASDVEKLDRNYINGVSS